MFPSKHFFILACLLCLALPADAEKPNDNRSLNTDSRSSTESRYIPPKTIGGKTVDEWAVDLKARDPSTVKEAVLAMIGFQDQSGRYVAEVAKVMHHSDASPKMKAIMAMRMMYIPETHKGLVFKELGRCLIDPYSEGIHRYEAARSLIELMRRFGPPQGVERDFVFNLVRIAGSSRNSEVREICIDALITAGSDPNKGPETRVTDALILLATPIREPAESVRYKAIMALGALGRPQDPSKLQNVVNVLKNPGNYKSRNRIIRMWTHVSLMALGEKIPKAELEAIVKLLDDPTSHIKIQAVTALGALGDKANAYVGNICNMVKREKDPNVLMIVAQAIGRMKTKGKVVQDTLVKITELENREYVGAVIASCQAFKELGMNDAGTMQALDKVLKHTSFEKYEKKMVEQIIEDIKNPKKPLKRGAARVGR